MPHSRPCRRRGTGSTGEPRAVKEVRCIFAAAGAGSARKMQTLEMQTLKNTSVENASVENAKAQRASRRGRHARKRRTPEFPQGIVNSQHRALLAQQEGEVVTTGKDQAAIAVEMADKRSR